MEGVLYLVSKMRNIQDKWTSPASFIETLIPADSLRDSREIFSIDTLVKVESNVFRDSTAVLVAQEWC